MKSVAGEGKKRNFGLSEKGRGGPGEVLGKEVRTEANFHGWPMLGLDLVEVMAQNFFNTDSGQIGLWPNLVSLAKLGHSRMMESAWAVRN